jgi:hypothetical protein
MAYEEEDTCSGVAVGIRVACTLYNTLQHIATC